ncbi:MAG TPA: DUF86 domain-containing protein [Anaerolineae bacterium]|nr:DUF86 domain-containing protein [Anaerolineae bacterium]
MTGVDRDRVRTLLGRIAEAQEKAARLGKLSEEEFLGDFRNTESAKYLLIVAVEAALDLCQHLAARGGGRAPESYADCFTVLHEMGILPADLAESLRRMARLRNLLVHLYWEVDDRRVYYILQESLGDLTSFREVVSRWVMQNT